MVIGIGETCSTLLASVNNAIKRGTILFKLRNSTSIDPPSHRRARRQSKCSRINRKNKKRMDKQSNPSLCKSPTRLPSNYPLKKAVVSSNPTNLEKAEQGARTSNSQGSTSPPVSTTTKNNQTDSSELLIAKQSERSLNSAWKINFPNATIKRYLFILR